ncbi:hypothetical protein IWW36_005890 [Coemansia brasiliensis]|uniref:Uncharacterized protein n=1 Tax=Coemansia brasiliensis TaxID=2650707 RepID=A0A9W8I0I4_9FUNG|nr:hypothetical protein IWW36_005890 [Coemansia brasiliensis]
MKITSIALVFGALAVVGQSTPLPQTQSIVRIGHDISQDQSIVRIGHDRDGGSTTEQGSLDEETDISESEASESNEESSEEPSEESSEDDSDDEHEDDSSKDSSEEDSSKDNSTDELSDDEDEVGTSTVFVDESTEIVSATISESDTTSNAYRNLVSLLSLSVVGSVSVILSAF